MAVLIPEILFEIGKKLVENGDSEAVILFGLSGSEPLKALKNVFASVSTLKLYDDDITVGWGDRKSSTLNVKQVPKFLMSCIGVSVKELYVERQFNPIFLPIINIIVAQKQLNLFSAGYCNKELTNQILPKLSSTMKELSIPSQTFSDRLFNSLFPESLTLLDVFNPHLTNILNMLSKNNPKSLFKLSLKHLTIIDKTGFFSFFPNMPKMFANCFSNLETLQFIMKYDGYVKNDLQVLLENIKQSENFPSKIKYTVLSNGDTSTSESFNRHVCANVCQGFEFEYSASNPMYYYFHQTFETAKSQKIFFEVTIPKRQKMSSEF